MTRSALWLVLAAVLGAALPGAAADLRRHEAVGVVPIQEESAGSATWRDRAVAAAVSRAVELTAREALPDGAGPPPGDSETGADPGSIAPELVEALGEDPFEYATRFRILEDRGQRPALLSGSDAETEYVVLVEVFVDAGRIGDRLAAAGWLDPAGGESRQLRLVLEGLGSFGAYEALRRTLLDEIRVRSAVPLEFSRGRAVLAVDSDEDVEGLLAALVDATEPGLRVVPIGREEGTLTVLVDWTPPLAPAEGGGPPPAAPARRPD